MLGLPEVVAMTTQRYTNMFFTWPAALALVACAASTPAEVTSPATSPPGTTITTTTTTTETPAQAAGSGNIQIAQEILVARGISAADAFFPFDSARLERKDIKPL